MSGTKVCFFVHECYLEAGHTRAMIEVIRALPPGTISELHLIYFEGSSTKELLPEFSGKVIHHIIPGKFLSPFLLKAIFYQVYAFFMIRFVLPSDSIKIGIGTACLNVDVSNVQFVQKQWEPHYFKGKPLLSPSMLYKRVLFYYFNLCENYLFRKESLGLISLSQFVTDYLTSEFNIPLNRIRTAYSSVNLSHFPEPSLEREKVFSTLIDSYPQLKDLNTEKPIYLFVGAYERKGLYQALDKMKELENSQIIVIGKPEKGKTPSFPENPKVIRVPFTKELSLFYELSDVFIFPTVYEPFGLVVAEAASMGNLVYVPRNNVGASEILENLESVKFLNEDLDLHEISPLSLSEKVENSKAVRDRLKEYSWEKAAKEFLNLIAFFDFSVDKNT